MEGRNRGRERLVYERKKRRKEIRKDEKKIGRKEKSVQLYVAFRSG